MAFNRLTDAEAERLAILAEECGEVVQIVGKILRHGYEEHHPNDPPDKTNRKALERELSDLYTIIDWMSEIEDVSGHAIGARLMAKRNRMAPYLHHNRLRDVVG
jgi:NTP pyrophosphatase (non-canonical NTP hydrolase)